jgi:hypothetical protein
MWNTWDRPARAIQLVATSIVRVVKIPGIRGGASDRHSRYVFSEPI